MSTNFYAKHIPTESDYKTMQEALTARQLEKLAELLHDAKKIYHIGKRSGGWQFEFVPHIDQSLECVVGTVTKGFKGDSPVSISEGWVNGCWHPLH